MPTFIIPDTTIASFLANKANTHYIYRAGLNIDSTTDAFVIDATVKGMSFDIDGTLESPQRALIVSGGEAVRIDIGMTADINATMTGFEVNSTAGLTTTAYHITNAGAIRGNTYGVALMEDRIDFRTSGYIAGGMGIIIDGNNNRIVNSGTISAPNDAVRFYSDAGEKNTFINSGYIDGDGNYAITGASGREFVTNSGLTIGSVDLFGGADRVLNLGGVSGSVGLGSGHDVYEDRPGATVVGTIEGGLGDDLFIIRAAGQTASEQDTGGDDTLRCSTRVTVQADCEMETIILFGGAAFSQNGSNTANTMTGNGAANTLNGRGGNDILAGMGGNDRLIGGDDADRFVFHQDGSRDRIADFVQGVDTIDVSRLSGIRNLADLKANHLSTSHGDAVITDGATRIVIEGMGGLTWLASDFQF